MAKLNKLPDSATGNASNRNTAEVRCACSRRRCGNHYLRLFGTAYGILRFGNRFGSFSNCANRRAYALCIVMFCLTQHHESIVSPTTMALQLLASLAVGIIAAAWPAWKMSRLNIVNGLRHVG